MDTTVVNDNDGAPILAAAALMVFLEEWAEETQIISERMARKKMIEELMNNESVNVILEVEAEVAQEIFKYAIKMFKIVAGDSVQSLCDGKKFAPDVSAQIVAAINSIVPSNPYGEET